LCSNLEGLKVLLNAAPWLPVPPPAYGGIENVIASLVPQLRSRGMHVVLATVAASTIAADERVTLFAEGQHRSLYAPYRDVMGIASAHMHRVIDFLRDRPDVDIVHDHLQVVGPSMMSLLGDRHPPTLHSLCWDLGKHRDFYSAFDGRGRVFFNAVSGPHLRSAHPNIRAQCLGVVPNGVPIEGFPTGRPKQDYFVSLARICHAKGTEIAARACRAVGVPLRLAGPVAGAGTDAELEAVLADAGSHLAGFEDVRYYQERVRPLVDGERVAWVGTVAGADKLELLAGARAMLAPVQWDEPGAVAAVEAFACGTPIIAMRRGVYAEMIEDGVTGFLADDEEQFTALLRRVDELDPRRCRAAAERRYSASAMAEGYLDLYRTVVERAPRG
jgi:glycosyltransferase involved in cell wall biosynthesis